MYSRIYLQDGLVTGFETLAHLDPLVPDSWLDGITLPAAPILDDEGKMIGIRNLDPIPYEIDKTTITIQEQATIMTLPDVALVIDGVEYPADPDNKIVYSDENPGQHVIVLKKHGYKDAEIILEVV